MVEVIACWVAHGGKKAIRELERGISSLSMINNDERLQKIDELKAHWNTLDPEEVNRLLHLIISKVSLLKTDKENVDITIEYK